MAETVYQTILYIVKRRFIGSVYGLRIRIQVTQKDRIQSEADLDPQHCTKTKNDLNYIIAIYTLKYSTVMYPWSPSSNNLKNTEVEKQPIFKYIIDNKLSNVIVDHVI